MLLVRRMLFQWEERLYRILWVEPTGLSIAVIDVNEEKANPTLISMTEFSEQFDENLILMIKEDPYSAMRDESSIPEKYKQIRDKAWVSIQELINTEPQIYIRNGRGKLILQAIEKHSVGKKYLYKQLRRYWQRGLIKNALLPDYENSGGKDSERQSSDKKRGRPRKYGDATGKNVTDEDKRSIRAAIDLYYHGGAGDDDSDNTGDSLVGAHDSMVKYFYSDHEANEHPDTQGRILPEDEYPSLGQFKYWYRKFYKPSQTAIKKHGINEFNNNMRAVLGTSTAETIGPGYRYQIDATMADVYLVARNNRSHIIGRPIIYVIIDVYSRVVAGIYIGLESPSWTSAGMALINMVEDKVEYCRKFGIEIEDYQWPSHHMPQRILGDRGEMETALVDTFENEFTVNVENTPPYRADWKGAVEQRFRLIHITLKNSAPAYVTPGYRKRGKKDYRLDAKLDIDQFTRIIIRCLIGYNTAELPTYDRDEFSVDHDVQAIPAELWQHGIVNRMGNLREFSTEDVRYSVLRREQGTVTERGIKFRHCYYSCETALNEEWFEKARSGRSWKVDIAFDPRNLTTVFLVTGERKKRYEACKLTPYSRGFTGKSLWEIEEIKEWEKNQTALDSHSQRQKRIDTTQAIEDIVNEAEEMAVGRPKLQVKDVKENQKREKAEERRKETEWLDDKSEPDEGKTAEIHNIHGHKPKANSRHNKLMNKLKKNRSEDGDE
ncbi:MAG: DDE-type integrase/transposase/recombinase [Hahellaceae bacterium]|nr:DDE-type integrase/transposase/recombinase [Hahellaceae bacterium]MCP5210032.1 DDE-type integrase/transposase/recombinase [Hahellaceae bacterium]